MLPIFYPSTLLQHKTKKQSETKKIVYLPLDTKRAFGIVYQKQKKVPKI